jgi:DNA-binding Lrp family transcriptional regulator
MITDFDKALLNKIQTNLPIANRPFAVIAEELGVDEEAVLTRLRELKAAGFIRKIGAFFNSEELGYTGTLVAVRVKPDFVSLVAEKINTYDGVTHNYERYAAEHDDIGKFNIWFTVIVDSEATRREILNEISALPGVEQLINLPAIQKYKVSVRFSL